MEKQSSRTVVCPVCSLFLREGISLKSHLQTHSKEKVIEALLKQDPLYTENGSSNALASNKPNRDTTTISVAENRFFASLNRSTLSVVPSSNSYIQSSNNQITQTTESLTYDTQSTVHEVNGLQFFPSINNNIISQASIANPCNTILTYHQFITTDGNVVLIPVYNVSPASVMLPNNIAMSNSMVNSCVVMPPTSTVQPVSVVNSTLSESSKFNSTDVQNNRCVSQNADVDNMELNNNRIDTYDITSRCNLSYDPMISECVGETEEEKQTDEEVASIFNITRQTHDCEEETQTTECANCKKNESSDSELEDDKSSCDSLNYLNVVQNEACSPSSSMYLSENFREATDAEVIDTLKNVSISPAVSVIRVRNDLNYGSDNSNYHTDDMCSEKDENNDEENGCILSPVETVDQCRFTPVASTSHNLSSHYDDDDNVNETLTFSRVDKSNEANCNVTSNGCINNEIASLSKEKEHRFNFVISNSDNATHILPDTLDDPMNVISKSEKEHYILPNEIPSSDYNFTGIRNSFLTSASLISSVNKTMFADVDVYNTEKNKTNFFDKFEANIRCASTKIEERSSMMDGKSVCFNKFIERNDNKDIENVDSNGNSRISPFNIQTDELMPARGELSGQESLSGTENSIWELQVQQSIQRYNVTCQSENGDIKIGLRSLITEMNIKKDTDIKTNECEIIPDIKGVVEEVFRKKIIREFRCFYCKSKFDTWKLRQSHIAEEHADEDGLTTESLFGKKVKCKIENEENNEEIYSENIICRICSASFLTSMSLLKHLKMFHGIKKRNCVCPTCFVQFDTTEAYQEHIQKVHPYECMTCGKKFYTRPGYMLHQKRHMKIKPYSCDVCDKSFVTKQKLSEHINIHTGENPIKCDLCDCNFKRYSNYQQHKKYLHLNCKRKLKDFICDCGEIFHSKVKLMWHREIHDEKPKQCPFCVERFVHTASLTRHVRKWHNETYLSDWVNKKKIKNVTCPICNISYLHTSLQTHMKIHEGIKPYSCSECSKTFRTKWNLQLHRWTHMSRSAKPFKCKLCIKAYIHKTDYDAHVRSHNNCRPYACNVCGRQFIRKYNCVRHMREHKEPRSYKCDVCGKLFSRSYYLTEHEKIHTGEKPHVCHICGKSSATKSNHNKHVKMHNIVRESVNSEG